MILIKNILNYGFVCIINLRLLYIVFMLYILEDVIYVSIYLMEYTFMK